MIEFFTNYWHTLLTTVSIPIAYLFGGKQKQKLELRKSGTDAVQSMQSVYDSFLSDYKEQRDEILFELKEVRIHNKELQRQFNEIQLAYAKEVETSQNWEKLHKELTDKYKSLEKAHEALKTDHEKLRLEFGKLLKASKAK